MRGVAALSMTLDASSVIILGSSSAKPKINATWRKFPNAAHAPSDKDVLAFVLGDCWLTRLAHLQSGQVEPRTLSPRLSRRHHRRYQQLSIAAKTLRVHPRSTAVAATPTGHFTLTENLFNLKNKYIPNMNHNLVENRIRSQEAFYTRDKSLFLNISPSAPFSFRAPQ